MTSHFRIHYYTAGKDEDSLKNKAAKALNAGIKNLISDKKKSSSSDENSFSSSEEDNSSSEENSSSSEEEDDSSSEEKSSSEEEEDTPATKEDPNSPKSDSLGQVKNPFSVISKLPTFEFFFDQEDLGIDYLDASDDSSRSNFPGDIDNQFQPKIGVPDNKEEMEDEYSTFAKEKNPTLDFSFEEEELGIEHAEHELKENTYFPNLQGPGDIFQKSDEINPIFDTEDDELGLRRRDVQNIVQNDVKSYSQKNEDCSNPNLELDFVVCLIKETYESITSQFTK